MRHVRPLNLAILTRTFPIFPGEGVPLCFCRGHWNLETAYERISDGASISRPGHLRSLERAALTGDSNSSTNTYLCIDVLVHMAFWFVRRPMQPFLPLSRTRFCASSLKQPMSRNALTPFRICFLCIYVRPLCLGFRRRMKGTS